MASVEDKEKSLSLTDPDGAKAESDRLLDVADYVLKRARELGADAAELGASVQAGLDVTVRMQEVETVEYSRDRGVGISVYFGQRKGTASTADLQQESIDASIETACTIARYTEEDPYAGLAAADRMAENFPDLDLWHPGDLDVDGAIDLGQRMEAAGLDHDPLITNSEGATVSTALAATIYANTHGFRGRRLATRHHYSCSLLAGDGSNKQRDYYYDVKRSLDDLSAPEAIGREAARRAVARHGARSIGTRRVPVLFIPETARSLFAHLVAAVSGGNLYRGSSFLVDAAGQMLFPDHVMVEEQPLEPRGLRSTAFDSEGVGTRQRRLIDHGLLTGYVLSSYSARKLGLESTGNAGGVHNLTVHPGADASEDLMRGMRQGLVVTELMGQGVNITTGDYSRGASGFWVADGEIAHPVNGVTIAGNLRDMFAAVGAIGNDLDRRSGIRTPSLVIERMTVAGE